MKDKIQIEVNDDGKIVGLKGYTTPRNFHQQMSELKALDISLMKDVCAEADIPYFNNEVTLVKRK